ncbi:Sporulation-specific protein [Spathaspora sp. JA1]|nr:Sporulation-specific protein [Spathaspora sp. JA1]
MTQQLASNFETLLKNFIKTSNQICEVLAEKEANFSQVQSQIDIVLPLAESMYRNVDSSIQRVQLPTELQESLEAWATEMWNKCGSFTISSLSTNNLDTIYNAKLLSIVLLLIYELLNPSIDRSFRNTSCLVELLTMCVSKELKSVAKKCQFYGETVIAKLNKLNIEIKFDTKKTDSLHDNSVKFYMSSLILAILCEEFKQARIYDSKLNELDLEASTKPNFVFECSRSLYNSALFQFQKDNSDIAMFLVLIAIKYLEIDIPFRRDSRIFKELYFHSYILLVKCYKSIGSPDLLTRAKTALEFMQNQFAEEVEIYYLYFEVNPNVDEDQVEHTLMRMVMSIDLNSNVDRVLYLLKERVKTNFRGVNKCLDYLFSKQGFSDDQLDIFLTTKFVMNAVLSMDEAHQIRIGELNNFIQLAERKLTKQLSLTTRSSVIALVWNQGMKCYNQEKFNESIEWFQLALSRLFFIEYSTNQDRGKVLRAIQNSYIALEKFEESIQVINSMEEEDKQSTLTQYNLFRSQMSLGREKEALKCISKIATQASSLSIMTTAACIIEAKSKISNEAMLQTMLSLLTTLIDVDVNSNLFAERFKSHEIVIPVAIRCTVVMLCAEIEKGNSEDNTKTLLEMLEKTSKVAKKINQQKGQANKIHIFTIDDLEWFASKAFNTAITCHNQNKLLEGSKFCKLSIQFIDLIPIDIETSKHHQLLLWKMRSNCMELLFTCNSRNLDTNEWNRIRIKCLELREQVRAGYSYDLGDDWVECHKQILVFHFQSELISGTTQNLFDIVEDSKILKPKASIDLFDVFVGLMVDAETMPSLAKTKLLATMIDITLMSGENSKMKLAISWMRILLSSSDNNYGAQEETLMLQIYRVIKLNNHQINVPTFEIEWLSTNVWNFGVVLITRRWELDGVLLEFYLQNLYMKD